MGKMDDKILFTSVELDENVDILVMVFKKRLDASNILGTVGLDITADEDLRNMLLM